MSDNRPWGILLPFKRAPLPPLPSILTALGPGVIFMALAQGSGELIWWPLHYREVRPFVSISVAARLPAPVSRDL